jgi:hypothetical protein
MRDDATMTDPQIVDAWLENQQLERLSDYLKRGRPLADVGLEDLRSRWVALMQTWARITQGFDHQEREDIEAEMQLRKVEPPRDLAKEAIETLRRKSKERADKLLADPARYALFEKELANDIEQFEATIKRNKN